ncbi:MAG TPA: carbonate dehydratase [Chitinophagaceae bacterium]|jgi:carbonic anhydrase|nr:carbonate dehydratase [Chitinophagaceae bacterium]
MDRSYQKLIQGNKLFSETKIFRDPGYFERLAKGQTPDYLWIGCSDSRVPANEVTNTESGEIFVHRNIANLVIHTDTNLLSVLEYAVKYLKVKHIIVCGHYNCGGVKASMTNNFHGFVDNWLRNIKDVYYKHREELDAIREESKRVDRLSELNVVEQVRNLAKSAIVQEAWSERELHLHGWIYGLHDGLIKDLSVIHHSQEDIDEIYRFDAHTKKETKRSKTVKPRLAGQTKQGSKNAA